MKDYRTIVAGTDGSGLAPEVVARAAWLAVRDDAELVIVCAFSDLPRRTEARNMATLGGDPRIGQVLGRELAGPALDSAVATARAEGAAVAAALLVDGEPASALIATATERSAGLIVLGAIRDRSLVDRLLGTVASEVIKRADCDVLVVRPAGGSGALTD